MVEHPYRNSERRKFLRLSVCFFFSIFGQISFVKNSLIERNIGEFYAKKFPISSDEITRDSYWWFFPSFFDGENFFLITNF